MRETGRRATPAAAAPTPGDREVEGRVTRRRAVAPSPASAGEGVADLVIDLLDAIESLVVNGRRVPFSAAVVVNEDEALDYIDRARVALPEDLKQARQVVERQQELVARAEDAAARLLTAARQEADQALAAAHEEAERVVASAHSEAERVVGTAHAEAERVTRTAADHASALISGHAVTAAAEERAAQIAAEAASSAEAYQAKADAYARDLLSALADQVERALAQLRRGIEALPATTERPARRR